MATRVTITKRVYQGRTDNSFDLAFTDVAADGTVTTPDLAATVQRAQLVLMDGTTEAATVDTDASAAAAAAIDWTIGSGRIRFTLGTVLAGATPDIYAARLTVVDGAGDATELAHEEHEYLLLIQVLATSALA